MSQPRGMVLPLMGATLFGSALRVWRLGEKSFWIDELISLCHAESIHNVTSFFTPACGNAHPPLYFLLLKGWAVFGDGEVYLRLLSVIFGIAVIPAVFFLGRELSGKKPAIVAAFLVAVSPFHLLYDREVRMYSLLTFLTIWSLYFFIKALKTDKPFHWSMYTALSVLNMYVHYHAILVLLFEWVFFLVGFRKYRHLVWKAAMSQAVVAGAFAWWLPGLLFQIRNPALFALDAPDKFPVAAWGWLAKPLYVLASFSLGQTILPWNPAATAGGLLFAALALLGVKRLMVDRELLWLIGLAFCVPFVVASLISQTMPRYFIFLAPLYYLVIAEGLYFFQRQWIQVAVCCLLLIPISVSANNYYYNREFHILAQVDPWREVGAYIRENAQPEDCLVAIGSSRPLGYYLGGFAKFAEPICGADFEDCVKCLNHRKGRRLWIVAADPALKTETEHARRWFDAHFIRLGDKRFYRDPDYQMKAKLFKKDFLEYRISVFLYGKA